MNKRLASRFLFFYVLIITCLSMLYILQYNRNVKHYLQTKTNQHMLQYKAIYDKYKVLSKLIFDTDINTKETINIFKNATNANKETQKIIRAKLLNHLKTKYKKLKNYNLKQLHFHLPNNTSFLRMHRPNKYGDDLTNYRATVNYVNKHRKYIDGFEEGRIFNGYRFVYPLFDKKKYLGSVEISFSALAMIQTISNTFNLHLSFLVKKDIVDKKLFKEELKNYLLSPNKNFYFEKKIYHEFPPISSTISKEEYSLLVKENKPITIATKQMHLVKTIIPLKNPVTKEIVAIICICEKDKYLLNDKNDLISKIFISLVLLALVFLMFYKQTVAKIELIKLNKELDTRVKLEVKRGRKQDLQLYNQYKMASIGRMMRNIAHHWRQPLSVVSSCASGLKVEKQMNTLDDEGFEKYTSSILKQSEYLSKTLNRFKDYIEVEDTEKKQICVQTKMENVLEVLDPILKNTNICIKRKYEKHDLFVLGIKSELFETFNAIITNTCDAFSRNPQIKNKQITVTIKQKDDENVTITIRDNAGGIKKENLDKIFDPYFTTKHEYIGTGISLYLVYKLITENLKGKITVNEKSDGIKFCIELPLSN